MKKIDIQQAHVRKGSRYPEPFNETGANKLRRQIGAAAGLSQVGVNLLELPPGAWSSQRHWHSHNDEFIHVVAGEVVLITNAGEELLRAGDCAGFKAGDDDGHHLINRSQALAVVLEIGPSSPDDVCWYSDIDLQARGFRYLHKDGSPY
jgi:uncharacterized cupin superfamily protein